MDGALIVGMVVGGIGLICVIGGGFWKLGRAIGRIEGKLNGLDIESIARLVGKVDSLDSRMLGYEKKLTDFNRKFTRLNKRMNDWIDNLVKKEKG